MVCITAEIGVNWDGNFKIAEQMMIEAKNANCDAVKFQAFNEEIVKNHPESDVACYSANLTLDIYNGLKDFTSLRDVAFAYIENAKLSCGEIERNAIRFDNMFFTNK